ncbi:putative reverse transcriptase domain-containing protein [Tanacetum coccineum]|uniref:Reverse transcriptase domain-containing protein n=1 Tax=Tanacetum coccineum TaxID=301880 RepID=A0ABQ4ZNS8_9ASTR
MVNEIPLDYVDDVPVIEPNQHDDVPVVPEPVLVDEDEDPRKMNLRRKKILKKKKMIWKFAHCEDENEPELTYHYERCGFLDPLNPPPPTFEFEPDDEIEVENPIEHEDETFPVVSMRGFVFEERPNEAIICSDEADECPSLSRQGFLLDSLKLAMRRLIKESVDAAIAAERERQAKVRNDASGSGPVRGQDTAPAVRECTFVGFMKCNPTVFRGIEGAIELRRWFEKTKSVFGISECAEGKKIMNQMPWTEMKQLMTAEFCPIEEIQRMEHELWNLKVKEYDIVAYTQRFNELALMCPRMVKPERVEVDAYIRGLTDNIKGEVTSSNLADLNEATRMAHKLME